MIVHARTANDVGTAVVATTAVSSPLWLDKVQTVSDWAEWSLPILGAIWLVVQIVYKVREYHRGNGKR